MTHEDKVKYLTIGLNIMKYGFKPKDIDLMVRLYDQILETKGQTDLQMVAKIEADNEAAYPSSTSIL